MTMIFKSSPLEAPIEFKAIPTLKKIAFRFYERSGKLPETIIVSPLVYSTAKFEAPQGAVFQDVNEPIRVAGFVLDADPKLCDSIVLLRDRKGLIVGGADLRENLE